MSTNVKDILFDFCGSPIPTHISLEQYIKSLDVALSGYKGSIYSLVNHCIQNYQCCVPIWKCLLKYLPSAEVNGLCNLLCQYYACRRDTYKEEFPMEDIFDLFIKKGADINFIFFEQTYLSYLVKTNNVSLVKKCVEQYGANPHLSHLLIHACNVLTESQYHFIEDQKGGKPRYRITFPEKLSNMTTSYANLDVFSYLVNDLQLDVNEKDKNGLTPFIAVCSEGSIAKVQMILARNPDLHHCTYSSYSVLARQEFAGVDCWTWAKRNEHIYPILLQYKEQVRQNYMELLTLVEQINGTQLNVDVMSFL
jgi:hypothetical protein